MKLGFIGCGNMGGAVMEGILRSGKAKGEDVMIYTATESKMTEKCARLGVKAAKNNAQVAAECDVVFLAVKPYIIQGVLEEVKDAWRGEEQLVISVVSGWNIERLRGFIPEKVDILNTMPNTPCLVGEGVFAFNMDCGISKEQFAMAEGLLDALGTIVYIHENQIEALSGVCGCGPAYLYMMIEAMADGGVAMGLPRDLAMKIAAQTAIGAGKMVLETGMHPGALKDAVCSPKGATILGVHALEKGGLRAAAMDAVITSTEKMLAMAKE